MYKQIFDSLPLIKHRKIISLSSPHNLYLELQLKNENFSQGK